MIYEVEERGPVSLVRFQGDLEGGEEADLRRLLLGMSQEGRVRVAADMGRVSFLNSTVLGILVWGMKNLREAGGDLRLFGMQGFVSRLFSMTSMDKAFRVFETEQQALESYAQPQGEA